LNWLDPHAGIQAHLLLAALQHIFVEEFNQLGALAGPALPLDASVNILRCFRGRESRYPYFSGCFTGDGVQRIADGTHAGVEIKDPVAGSRFRDRIAAANGRGQRPLMATRNSRMASTVLVGKPVVELALAFSPAKTFKTMLLALAVVGFFHRPRRRRAGRLSDVAPRAVAFNVRNDRIVGGRRVCHCCNRSCAAAGHWVDRGTELAMKLLRAKDLTIIKNLASARINRDGNSSV